MTFPHLLSDICFEDIFTAAAGLSCCAWCKLVSRTDLQTEKWGYFHNLIVPDCYLLAAAERQVLPLTASKVDLAAHSCRGYSVGSAWGRSMAWTLLAGL